MWCLSREWGLKQHCQTSGKCLCLKSSSHINQTCCTLNDTATNRSNINSAILSSNMFILADNDHKLCLKSYSNYSLLKKCPLCSVWSTEHNVNSFYGTMWSTGSSYTENCHIEVCGVSRAMLFLERHISISHFSAPRTPQMKFHLL